MGKFKPEFDFILTCLRQQSIEETKKIISSLIKDGMNWDDVLESACHHKVLPFLNSIISNHFKTEVPEEFYKKLSYFQNSISLQNLQKSASLINLVRLLNNNSIEVLPIKGPLLSEKLYGASNMRMYGDLDILVRRKDVNKALDILLGNKYTLFPTGIPRSTYDRFMKHAYHGGLLDPFGTPIELHWELTGFYVAKGIIYEDIEPYLLKTSFYGDLVLDLTPEMLFFYLCVHGIKHQYDRLDYICTLTALLKFTPDIDWSTIAILAQKYDITRGVNLSLALIDQLFTLSQSAKREKFFMADPEQPCIADSIIEHNLRASCKESVPNPLPTNSIYRTVVFNKRPRLVYRAKFIPFHEEWERVKLPDSLFYVYFINKAYRVLFMSLSHRLNLFKMRYAAR